jgi:hypothetical protein
VKFRSDLQERKNDHGITELESNIPPFSLSTLDDYFTYMIGPASDIDHSTPPILQRLLDFYNAPWYRKRQWDAKEASTACIDYSIKALLRMANGSEGHDKTKNKNSRNVVFCVGLASFNSRTGLPSKHTVVSKRFITRVSVCVNTSVP